MVLTRNSQPDGNEMSADSKKESTEMEIKTRKEKLFKTLNESIAKIKEISDLQNKDGNWNTDLLQSLKVFLQTYFTIKRIGFLPVDVVQKYRREAGQRLSKSKSTSVICKVIMDGWQRLYTNENREIVAVQYEAIRISFVILVNFSDCTSEVVEDITKESNFLETINRILTVLFPAHVEGNAKEENEYIMKWCLSILHNTSKVARNFPNLRRLEIVPVCRFFLAAKKEVYRLLALSTLANMINEKESSILRDNTGIVSFLLTTLGLAVKDPDHRHKGWSAQECAMTVCRLARNDANKKLLVQMGCLPHLVDLAKSGNVEEQREAVGAIWILAFEKENHKKILDDTEFNIIDLLKELKEKSSDADVKGLLMEHSGFFERSFKILTMSSQKSATSVKENTESPEAPVHAGKGRIMISYNWRHQKKVLRIQKALEADGYDVWIDVKDMSGSILQAMALGVEQAHVFLMCISQLYKDSPYCRAEAEYAFQLRKKIVPLKMEHNYKADGWLGLVLGTKLYVDFSGRNIVKKKIEHLKRQLATYNANEDVVPNVGPIKRKHQDTMDTVDVSVMPRKVHIVQSAHCALIDVVRKWTPDDVSKWLEEHNLPENIFGKLTGRQLGLLITMRSEAPEHFYSFMEKNLGFNSLETMAMFIEGLNNLSI